MEEKLIGTLEPSSAPCEFRKEETKKQIRGSAMLLTGRFLGMAINLGSQVLLVRYLSKSGFGAFAYALAIVSLGSSIAVFGLEKSVSRFVATYQEQREDGKVLGTILLMVGTVLSVGFTLVLLVFALKGWLSQSLIHDQEAMVMLLILIALSPVQALESLFTSLLSIFARPRAIFFRRYLIGPSLYFVVVLLLILGGYDISVIAVGYLAAGGVGVVISTATLISILRRQGLLCRANFERIKIPAREVFSFTTPLLISDFVFVLRAQFVVVLLEYFQSTSEVAAYRAVAPLARFNILVYQNFLILFLPLASRLFARKDWDGMNNLYQQTAVWIAVISFPVFAVSSSLSGPLITMLFGERYEQSAVVLTLLAIGFYFSAALGFNGQSLRIFGRTRYLIITDLVIAVISIIVSLALIPRYGALGAAISVCSTLILQNVVYQIGLMFCAGVGRFSWEHVRVYLIIFAAWAGLLLLPPLSISFVVAALVSLLVFLLSRKLLDVRRMFPELMRLPLMGRIFSS